MSIKRLFAVDMGASGGKCFVGTFEDGSFSMQELHRFPHGGTSFHISDKNGVLSERTVWDDTAIYRNIIEGLHAYRREVSDSLDSVGIDTWGADGHFLSSDGDMLGKVYCYRDHRLDDMVEKVKAKIDADRIYEITGIHFQPFNLSNQLLWFVENRSDLLQQGCFFLPIPSLFYYYLGGMKKVDSSWASVTQLMDARTNEWSDEIINALGLPGEVLPEIVSPGTVIGELLSPVADSVKLNRAKLVSVAAHDTASAFASAPVSNTNEALIISAGTWCLIGKLVPEPITTPEAMAQNLSNEGGIGNVRLLKNCMGGWIGQELRRVWRIADGKEMSWKELDDLTLRASAFTSLINPDDQRFYNPANMEKSIAEFCRETGQPVPQDRGTYMRVVYESLALKYRMVNEQICSVTNTESKVIHIVGGGSRNVMLNQFTADAAGLPVVAGPEEATAVGNLMVQAMGMGIIESMHDALPLIEQAFPIKKFKPGEKGIWDKAYGRFKQL